jgi:uncharacterized protein
LIKRVEYRRQQRLDPSDADVAVLDRQLQNMRPLRADERSHVVVVDTSQARAYERAVAAIRDCLARARDETAAIIKPHRRA